MLSGTVQDLRSELAGCEAKLEATEEEREEALAAKDADMAALKAKMEDMALEFGSMLNGTIDKMHERIELRYYPRAICCFAGFHVNHFIELHSNTNSFDADSGVRVQRK